MATFKTFDGFELHYDLRALPGGPPVVLLHSFGLDSDLWQNVGVTDALLEAGRTVLFYDARGHGRSAKPHDSAAYGSNAMARDLTSLLDHLGIGAVDLVSYSMGSMVALRVLQLESRIRAAVLGGVGERALHTQPPEWRSQAADGFEADDPELCPAGLRYARDRADRLDGDRHALAAVLRAGFSPAESDYQNVQAAVLILTGARDHGGPPEPLAQMLPGARSVTIDADHATAMEHPDFIPNITSFLAQGTPPPAY